jgi:hypothetical protein
MTVTIGWEWLAGLLVWSAVAFRIGMAFGGTGGRSHLEGHMPVPAARRSMAPPTPRGLAGPTPQQLAEICEQIRLGNKINAIKRMREATNMGLAEAKHAVEAMTP